MRSMGHHASSIMYIVTRTFRILELLSDGYSSPYCWSIEVLKARWSAVTRQVVSYTRPRAMVGVRAGDNLPCV